MVEAASVDGPKPLAYGLFPPRGDYRSNETEKERKGRDGGNAPEQRR